MGVHMGREPGGARGAGGPGDGPVRLRIEAARRFVDMLADSGEPVRWGEVTVHIADGRLRLEIRRHYR